MTKRPRLPATPPRGVCAITLAASDGLPATFHFRWYRSSRACARHILRFADEVQAPVDAVRAVDVRVAGWAEHRRVARRAATVAVARRVLLVVGLDFDDPPTYAVDEQRRADQLGRDLVDAAREELSRERVRRNG